nr:twin transmembrane helix small protein [Roseomonas sp. SXEYE001]
MMPAMITFLTILVGLGMLATLGTLFAGMVGMVRGGENLQRSNALMRWRVMLQGVTLGLFALLLFLMRG